MEKPDAVSATPSRTEALRARGRRCETHIPRAPHSLASKTTIYRAGSRRTDGRHPLLRVLNFPPTLTFLSREDGRENCEERPLALAMGEGVLVPHLLSRSRSLQSPASPHLGPPAGGPADRSAGRRLLRGRPSASRSNYNSPPPKPPSLRAPATFRPPPPTRSHPIPPTLFPRIFSD